MEDETDDDQARSRRLETIGVGDLASASPTSSPSARNDAADAMDRRLKQGWTEQDWSDQRLWFFPAEQRLWDETGEAVADRAVLAAHPDAIRVLTSGCPRCLVGYADIMSDPGYTCSLCRGTGFPVFREDAAQGPR